MKREEFVKKLNELSESYVKTILAKHEPIEADAELEKDLAEKIKEIDGFVALAVDVFNERDRAGWLISKIRKVLQDCARNSYERNIDYRYSAFAAIVNLVEAYDLDKTGRGVIDGTSASTRV